MLTKHIPNIFPNFHKLVSDAFDVIHPESSIDHEIINRANTSGHNITLPSFNKDLWKASRVLKQPLLKLLEPAVTKCVHCGSHSIFCRSSSVTWITVFTTHGPIPAQKISLTCRTCNTIHHLKNYSAPDGNTYFYQVQHQTDYMSASNKVYFSRDVYELLCESGWVTMHVLYLPLWPKHALIVFLDPENVGFATRIIMIMFIYPFLAKLWAIIVFEGESSILNFAYITILLNGAKYWLESWFMLTIAFLDPANVRGASKITFLCPY